MQPVAQRFSVKLLAGHILFWVAYVYYQGIVLEWQNTDALKFNFSFHVGGISTAITILLTYFNLYVLLPAYYYTRRFKWYAFFLILSLLVGAVLMRFLTHEFILPWEKLHDTQRYAKEVKQFWIPSRIIRLAIQAYPVIAIVTVFELMQQAYRNEKRLRDIERERNIAEMNYLKAQINPHFFFNTLNSLYGLILKQSGAAADVVMRLSGLMRYVLNNSKVDAVPLADEVAQLQNYLSIEQVRFSDRVEMSFQQSGAVTGKSIMPLVLLPFAENAFKHGLNNGNGWITIVLKITGNTLFYEVQNSRSAQPSPQTNGLGLANLQKRLQLTYAGRFTMSIDATQADVYRATLKMEL